MSSRTSPPPKRSDRDRGKMLRWGAALLLVGAGVVVAALGREICREVVASVGTNPTTSICEPPKIDDLVVIGWLIAVVLLIWPDLVEVGFPGGFSLKRQVQEQGKELEEHGQRLTELTNQISQQQLSLQAQTTNVDVSQPDIAGVIREIPNLVKGLEHETAGDLEVPASESVPARRAQLESRLLRQWAKLEPFATLDGSAYPLLRQVLGTSADVSGMPSQGWLNSLLNLVQERALLTANIEAQTTLEAIRKWKQDFSQEIRAVHTTRNVVASGKSPAELTDDKLESIISLASVIWSTLEQRIEEARQRGREQQHARVAAVLEEFRQAAESKEPKRDTQTNADVREEESTITAAPSSET